MSDVLARLTEGCERVTWRSWPGAPAIQIGVRALSEPEWLATLAEARALVPHRETESERRFLAARAERRAIIRACIVIRDAGALRPLLADEGMDALDETTAADLLRSISKARDEAHGFDDFADQAHVFAEIDRVYARDRVHGVATRLRARFAGLCGFYGVTDARRLTDWQVLIYARLVREDDDE